jgi:hypothetical protein
MAGNFVDTSEEQINMRERSETQLWMQALDVDERTLRNAVSQAGTSVEQVRKYLEQRRKEALRLRPVKSAKTVRRKN